jgi:hypothetical protein
MKAEHSTDHDDIALRKTIEKVRVLMPEKTVVTSDLIRLLPASL